MKSFGEKRVSHKELNKVKVHGVSRGLEGGRMGWLVSR